MNSSPENPKLTMPLPDRKRLVKALGSETRWKMLKELTCGEARAVGELAAVAGVQYANAGRHLAVLRNAGLVAQGRGQLYQIPKQYLPSPGQQVVDYGHCLLRLDAGA